MALADTAGSMILPVAVRAYSIECVRGLPYTFYGTKYVGGRANGVGVDRARHDFPRARGRVVGTLYHRHLGSADPWQGVEGSIPTDEHGRWVSQAWGISDTDAARTLWEYALRADNMGRWATREYAMIEGYVSLAGEPDLAEDLPGRAVVVWVEGGDVWCARIETLTAVPDAPVMVVDADDASAPAVELLDDGLLVVTWMDGGATYMRHSTDGGRTWLDVV